MGESEPHGGTRYKAFVSYNHKDSAAARWLHRRLETYRIPGRLVGSQGLHGPVPARLTPIFRDREELPAAGDLSETVRAALAVSENLIVICSANAAASPWVGREIAVFRELHPGRPVYAAIASGEPADAFPPELLAGGTIEPLAADLRGEGDGRRLGFLKLAAGLAGVGLDALVQRDAQRRIRRVMAVTATAVAAMLVMAILTTMALTARAEAERQRAEAEGLVEFMLTDLRTRLRGVGRLDVMQAVNERAMAYYAKVSHERRLPQASTTRRARLFIAIAEDGIASGSLNSALLAYRHAETLLEPLKKASPNDQSAQYEHAKTIYGIGRVHEIRREWGLAKFYFEQFSSAARHLHAIDPDNPDYVVNVAASAVDLGNVAMNGEHDYRAAQSHYEKAVEGFTEAAALRPGHRDILLKQANAYGWLSDSRFAQGQWEEAQVARERQIYILQPLAAADGRNVEVQYRLALARRGLGHSFRKVGKRDLAREHLFAARSAASWLAARDPQNADWLLFDAMTSCDLLFGGVGFPQDTSRAELTSRVNKRVAALTQRQNPRVAELKNCTQALGGPAA
jgi:tetratricopeptide (TPR) repeat protein